MLSETQKFVRSQDHTSIEINTPGPSQMESLKQPLLMDTSDSKFETEDTSEEEFGSDDDSNIDDQTGSGPHEEIIIPEDSVTRNIIRASHELALNMNQLFYQEATVLRKNTVFSPINVYSALALLQLAAKGQSQTKLAKLLGLPRNADEIPNYHERLSQMLKIIRATKKAPMYTGNGIFVQKDIVKLTQPFTSETYAYYNSKLSDVDFQYDSIYTTDYINQYISNRTDGRISQLFTSPTSCDDRLAIIAACSNFKAGFYTNFRRQDTKKKNFRTSSGRTSVIMMHRCGYEWYVDLPDLKLQAVRLPFESDYVGIYYVLPYSNYSLDDLMMELNAFHFRRIIQHPEQKAVDIKIPRMKYKWSNDIGNSLRKLGIERIFTTSTNFGNMVDDIELAISRIPHANEIKINENGLEVDGENSIDVESGPPPKTKPVRFHVNRPFLYFVYHAQTRAILLMGTVRNPNTFE